MQFKKVVNQDETWFTKAPWMPVWYPDGAYSGYVPGLQNGWRGPLTSYWARLHSRNDWFST